MNKFQHVERSVLVDMLAGYTARYTKIMTEGGSTAEYNDCRDMIEMLQKEINFRRSECDMSRPSNNGHQNYSQF